MNESHPLPSLDILKARAKRLRARMEQDGQPISHAKALELQAHQLGFRDWNTLHAAVGNRPPKPPVAPGDTVAGTYLGQPFSGEVIGVHVVAAQNRYRVTLHFDEPVDVVTFDSFSAYRQRVVCTVDGAGRTAEKTSDGRPHMELEI